MGQKTFGKGLVQSVRGLTDGSGLTVTIAKYLTPKGIDIHKNGIQPDVISMISDKEISQLSIDDLGTIKDKQYRVAETKLIKILQSNKLRSLYKPNTANLVYALAH